LARLSSPIKSFESSDGIRLAYQEWGEPSEAPPVVLHHGFVADADANWVRTGVVAALRAAERWVIAPDARGHGRSQKPQDPASYGEQRMAQDLARLLDVIGAPRVDLVGYSMGAVVCLLLASADARVRRLVVGGVGAGVVECGGVDRRSLSSEAIIEALSAQDASKLTDAGALAFRRLADAVGADRVALIAQASSVYRDGVELERIAAPTLVLAGDEDPLAVRPSLLSAAIPDARLQMVSGDHMAATVDANFAGSIVAFLAGGAHAADCS
jgi:pimeloyl-ACP methyl ester carboxylesterase